MPTVFIQKQIKTLFTITILFLAGCSVSLSYEKTFDYGYDDYYKIENTSVCFGSNQIGKYVSRKQVSCDTRPIKKRKDISENAENNVFLIDGVGKLLDDKKEGLYYFSKEDKCRFFSEEGDVIDVSCYGKQ